MTTRISRLADLETNYKGYTYAYNHPVMQQAMVNVLAAEKARKEREQAQIEYDRAHPEEVAQRELLRMQYQQQHQYDMDNFEAR